MGLSLGGVLVLLLVPVKTVRKSDLRLSGRILEQNGRRFLATPVAGDRSAGLRLINGCN